MAGPARTITPAPRRNASRGPARTVSDLGNRGDRQAHEQDVILAKLLDGKLNTTGEVTLETGGATATDILDPRIGTNTVAVLVPLNQDAAASLPSIAQSVAEPGRIALDHAASGLTRTFKFILIGLLAAACLSSSAWAASPSLVGRPYSSDPTCNAGEYYLAVLTTGTKWRKCENGVWSDIGATTGSGEANTASNLGGGLANYDSQSGVDLRFNSFNASHFDLASNVLSADEPGLEALLDLSDLSGLLPLSKITDDASSGKCLTSGGGGGDPSWVTCAGGGSGDFMADGSVPMTGDLDMDGNGIANLGDLEFNGDLTQNGSVDTTTAGATRVKRNNWKHWFAGDGTKTAGSKTKWIGDFQETVCLTEAECYGKWIEAVAGGDEDLVGLMVRAFTTGGSQDDGDEGSSPLRASNMDHYIDAVGTVSGTLTAGAGNQTLTIAAISEDESKVIGENKPLIFTALGTAVDIVDVPPGVFNSSGALDATDPTWVGDGSASGQGVWTLGAGQVTGVVAVGSYFRADLSGYAPFSGGGTAYQWLRITSINPGANQITTEWIGQGVDSKTPYGYLASENGVGTEGLVAPGGQIVRPTFTPDTDYAADTVIVSFPAAFSGATNPSFIVPSYGAWRLRGPTSFVSRMNAGGGGAGDYAFAGVNDLSYGRYQIRSGIAAQFAGDLADLADGTNHAFLYWIDCVTEPGACQYATGFRYIDDPSPVDVVQGFGFLQWPATDWAEDVARPIWDVYNDPAKTLTLDKTDGYGMDGDPFLLRSEIGSRVQAFDSDLTDLSDGTLTYSKVGGATALKCARFDGSGLLVPASGDCLSGDTGGGGSVLPVSDATSLVEDPVDPTREMRIDVGAVATGTVRVLSMPNFNVDLGAITSSSLAAGSVGTSQAAALDTGDVTTGTFADARIDGSLESDEITGLTDSQISNTLTSSNFLGSGSATTAVDLATAEVSGTLPVANGGTGATTHTTNALLKGNGTGAVASSGVTVDSSNNVDIPGNATIGGSSGVSTFTMHDMTGTAWVECGVVGTTMTCASDADGDPDGTL